MANEVIMSSNDHPRGITVVKQYEDYCVLLVTRGVGGPQELLKWLRGHDESQCFVKTPSVETPCDDDASINTCSSQAVLVSPHCKAYARSLVLVARDKTSLQRVTRLQLSMHCLCQGYIQPNTEQVLFHKLTDRQQQLPCRMHIKSLQVSHSNTLGHITLLEATNMPDEESSALSTLVPRQFRRQLKAAGFKVLGHTKDCQQFRGESLCMSVIKLHFENGRGCSETVQTDPAPRLKAIMEKEERFWREKASSVTPEDATYVYQGVAKPAAYLTGHAAFDGLEFQVNSSVMIPRSGSEAVVRRALRLYKEQKGVQGANSTLDRPWILDLGTGSGCLLLSLLHRLPHARGVGVDKSCAALDVAKQNALSLGLESRFALMEGDFSQLGNLSIDHSFDIVVCNPPYHTRGGRQQIDFSSVTHEPSMALFVEYDDMLVHYQNVVKGLAKLVHSGTILVFEVCRDNAKHVAALMLDNRMEQVSIGNDDKGLVRTAAGVFMGKEWTSIFARIPGQGSAMIDKTIKKDPCLLVLTNHNCKQKNEAPWCHVD
jgi:HemK-like putative methylase